jgi:hypothetical protein
MGKQPEDKYLLRGFLGFEWHEVPKTAAEHYVELGPVLKGSPAHRAGVLEEDHLLSVCGHPTDCLKAARAALAEIQASDLVRLAIERKAEGGKGVHQLTVTVIAEEGL